MKSVILSNAIRLILPLLLLFSLFLLVRGHNQPGGGFTGGLVAAAAFSLYAIAEGVDKAGKLMKISTSSLIGLGLISAAISGMLAFFYGEPFLTSYWLELEFITPIKIGTPLLFDFGVYLVVMGATLKIIFSLMED